MQLFEKNVYIANFLNYGTKIGHYFVKKSDSDRRCRIIHLVGSDGTRNHSRCFFRVFGVFGTLGNRFPVFISLLTVPIGLTTSNMDPVEHLRFSRSIFDFSYTFRENMFIFFILWVPNSIVHPYNIIIGRSKQIHDLRNPTIEALTACARCAQFSTDT